MRPCLIGTLTALAATILPAAAALAGGPLIVGDDGTPVVWSTSAEIRYRTDGGPLSPLVDGAAAQVRVANMFGVWEAVPSSSIAFARGGAIQDVAGFTDGDVNTEIEFDAVEGDCEGGNQSPIIYDADGAIFDALGIDVLSVIGFAGPCSFNPGTGRILAGEAVMNGLFLDGIANANNPADLTDSEFDATFVHEFGHFSGLDHSQINVTCASGSCAGDNLTGLPTMFPLLVSDTQRVLATDDIAWLSKLYPAVNFNATHGHVTGTIFFTDGESHAQGVNVIARRVDDSGTPGINESRTIAASNVSGYRFKFFHGNPITDPDPSPFGGEDPALIGLYEIPLPSGEYTIHVETIHDEFVEGSRVGGPILLPMPGSAPTPLGPITVTAGQTNSGNDVTLVGTEPRFDQFEGS